MIACHIEIDPAGIVTMRNDAGLLLTTCGRLKQLPRSPEWVFYPYNRKDPESVSFVNERLARECTIQRLEWMMDILGIGIEG